MKYRDEGWLRRKYHEEGLTLEQIGECCGVGDTTILNWMEEFGIERRPASPQPTPVSERFWEKVDKGDSDECWKWTGTTGPVGYGNFWNGERREGSHRVAYRLKEEDPGENLVLHHCDNPPCVNPNHLYLGDHKDNAADREERNPRDMSGENHPQAKLTAGEVREIKSKLESGVQEEELAHQYGVKRPTISHISLGHTWGEV